MIDVSCFVLIDDCTIKHVYSYFINGKYDCVTFFFITALPKRRCVVLPYYIFLFYLIFNIILNIFRYALWCSTRFLRKNHIPVVKLRGKSNGIFGDGHVLYLYQIRWTVVDSWVESTGESDCI